MSDQHRTSLEAAVDLLNTSDPRTLVLIGHDRRKSLASTLRLWAWAADEADRQALNEADVSRILRRFRPAPKSGVLAALHDGERAP